MLTLLSDLARHAAERPAATAVVSPEVEYTFAELASAVDAVAIRLRAQGVTPRDVVSVDLPSALEWVIDLALLRLATRSVSVRGVGSTGALRSDHHIANIGADWIADAVAVASGPAPFVDYARPDSICRLMLTSGTTGTSRVAAYPVAALEHRRLGLHSYWTDARPELNFMSLSTTGGFHTAVAALRHGQAFRGVDFINETTLRFAAQQHVEVLCGSPVQLGLAIEVISAHGIELSSLKEVRMAGATPSPALLRAIDATLGVPVRGVYGSTEGGGVTMRLLHADDDPANVGRVLPSLELEVNADGTIRYRGPGLVSGYYSDGSVTEFPRGWFSPGDTGSLTPDGDLVLAGRTAELLNIAGMKVDPTHIDDVAASIDGVRDAAAFGFERRAGIGELGLAVVGTPELDLGMLDETLLERLGSGRPTTLWRVAEIPRNRMGKVERRMLTDAFVRSLPPGD